jgi:hypothetical protein
VIARRPALDVMSLLDPVSLLIVHHLVWTA